MWVFAGGLMPASTASVVRKQDAALRRTDGPFLASKEHIGGFWVIDAADADAATAWAERGLLAQRRREAVDVQAKMPL